MLDPQGHAPAVDVADLERDHFARSQSGRVGERQRRLVLEIVAGGDQARDLLAAEHHRQALRQPDRLHSRHQLAALERDVEEELQPADRGVERHRRGAGIDQVQLVVAQVLHRGAIGRAPQIAREPAHRADVRTLRLGGELAHPHVVEHALAQGADGTSRGVHGLLLSKMRPIASSPTMASPLPMETTNFDARHERFSTPLPRERFSPMAVMNSYP